jgi:serine/threonine-protein kinase HipA
MAILDVYMNGYLIGEFTKSANGSHLFKYELQWLETPDSRPISLSMPLRRKSYMGDECSG